MSTSESLSRDAHKNPKRPAGRVVLDRGGVSVLTEDVALRQDIRPLQIALLYLMPEKIETETQLLRVLGATPLQIEMTLPRPGSYESKNTPQDHLTSRRFYMFNHLEYDAETLLGEYRRDRDAGLKTALPFYYFPDNDPESAPRMTWRAHRDLLFGNWINMVYQGTPYDPGQLEPLA